MATGRSTQLTGLAGEHLVAAELCRRGFVATTFAGNVPGFDICAINERSETILVQVKTFQKGKSHEWQFHVGEFLEILKSDDKQTVKGKKKLVDPNLIYILVVLKGRNRDEEQNQDEFYICRARYLQNRIHKEYTECLKRRKGKRSSTHHTVSPPSMKRYKNKWDIITTQ